jgi:hypothetical protein
MPRPLLEIWRTQNRDRAGEPSSLLLPHEALRRMQRNANMERLRIFAATAPAREMHEAMRLVAERLIPERLMGRMRPVSPTQTEPDKPEPKSKRKPGGGRKRSLKPEEIERGIRILHGYDRMTVEAARRTLRDAGIEAKDTPLYELVIRPAYASR